MKHVRFKGFNNTVVLDDLRFEEGVLGMRLLYIKLPFTYDELYKNLFSEIVYLLNQEDFEDYCIGFDEFAKIIGEMNGNN